MKTVSLKLGGMRKSDECVVYPEGYLTNRIFFQGDRLVGWVDPATGRARINYKTGSAYPQIAHLRTKGAQDITLSKETIDLLIAARPR